MLKRTRADDSTNSIMDFSNDERKSKIARVDKVHEFVKNLTLLNSSLYEFFKIEVEKNPYVNLQLASKDYIDYAKQLEDRYIRKYGEVFTFGSGDCGQLAHGMETDDDLMVKYPRIVYPLRDKKVIGISCGGLHNAVYTDKGEVYTWGCADDGSLGRIGDEEFPALVTDIQHELIISVACGDGQTLALTVDGTVYGWGCYKDIEGKKFFNIQPGMPTKQVKNQCSIPMKLSGLSDIVEISCGASICLALNSSGYVYSWGIGECGELGRLVPQMKTKILDKDGEEEMIYDFDAIYTYYITPSYMQYYPSSSPSSMYDVTKLSQDNCIPITNVKTIGCGSYHSLIVTTEDCVYATGLNNYAQLGLGDNLTRHVLYEVKSLRNKGIISVKGGVHHTMVLSRTHEIYTIGRGDSGQLGSIEYINNEAGSFSNIPLLIQLNKSSSSTQKEDKKSQQNTEAVIPIKQIACGGNHNLVLTCSHEVYTWGYGDMLALGHGQEKDEMIPRKINLNKVKVGSITPLQVAGGGQHSAIIAEVITTN